MKETTMKMTTAMMGAKAKEAAMATVAVVDAFTAMSKSGWGGDSRQQ